MQSEVTKLTRDLLGLGFTVEANKKTYTVYGKDGKLFQNFPRNLTEHARKAVARKAEKYAAEFHKTRQHPRPKASDPLEAVRSFVDRAARAKAAIAETIAKPTTVTSAFNPVTTVISEETITPDQAEAYLSTMKLNRSLRDRVVDAYARDMKAGSWRSPLATIVFNNRGELVDGQHRLWACVEAQVPFVTLVIRGAAPESFDVIDTGMRRTGGDLFMLSTEKNSNVLAALVKKIWQREMGFGFVFSGGQQTMTNSEMLATFERAPDQFREAAFQGGRVRKITQPTLAALAYFLMAEKDRDGAEKFFDQLSIGADLVQGSPIYSLRERLIRAKGSVSDALDPSEVVSLFIRAWNRLRDGDSDVKRLQSGRRVDPRVRPKVPDAI